jgi:hypothetical protein
LRVFLEAMERRCRRHGRLSPRPGGVKEPAAVTHRAIAVTSFFRDLAESQSAFRKVWLRRRLAATLAPPSSRTCTDGVKVPALA